MTIAQLQYIIVLAEYSSFSKAARKCSVTQPTITAQLRRLEEELGVVLFDRNKRNVSITETGKKFLEQAKRIVYEADKVRDVIDSEKGHVRGEFVLGIIPTVTPTLLPLFLSEFTKKYPLVKLVIEELTTQEIIYKLKNRRIHAGILSTPLEDQNLKENVLYREPFVGYVHPNSFLYREETISPEQINTNELLLLEDEHCITKIVKNFCKNKNEQNRLPFELKSGNFETIVNLVDKGHGITLLPYLHTLGISDENKSKLKFFKRPEPSREISIVHPKEELKTNIVDALQNTILESVKDVIPARNVKVISPF